jgi:hypothetical protein
MYTVLHSGTRAKAAAVIRGMCRHCRVPAALNAYTYEDLEAHDPVALQQLLELAEATRKVLSPKGRVGWCCRPTQAKHSQRAEGSERALRAEHKRQRVQIVAVRLGVAG